MRRHLPDPTFYIETCVRCGYDMRHAAAPQPCPECGALFDPQALMLAGVPRRTTTVSPLRRMAWIGVIGAGIAIFHLWFLFVVVIGLIGTGISVVVVIGALVVLLITGPRDRGSAERFAFTPDGVVRLPLAARKAHSAYAGDFVPFALADTVYFERLSPFWRRLRIGRRVLRSRRLRPVVFDAGVRCTDADADRVLFTITRLVEAAAVTAAPTIAAASAPSPAPGDVSLHNPADRPPPR